VKHRYVGLLSIGHLVTDINQGALPALLPFLISEHHLSYAAAAGIVFAVNIASTVVQPVFGYAADKFSKPWLLPVGLLLAGLGLAMTGIVPSYRLIILAAVVSGVGIAAYHPKGARLVTFAAGQQQATAMSLFGVGGTLGFALGPLFITAALLNWGLKGTLIMIVPVSVMALITFIPLYWIAVLDQSRLAGGAALTVLATAGVVGNVLGGKLADRFGHLKVMLGGFCLLIPLLPALIWVRNPQIAVVLLLPIGLSLYATYSPIIVMGHRYLPNHIGFSSGVTLGVAVAMGGVAAPLLGKVADAYGLWSALAVIALLPVLPAGLTLHALTSHRGPSMSQARA
jgi:FSR family fosmidomycin resistance protein-like MFS transporter